MERTKMANAQIQWDGESILYDKLSNMIIYVDEFKKK